MAAVVAAVAFGVPVLFLIFRQAGKQRAAPKDGPCIYERFTDGRLSGRARHQSQGQVRLASLAFLLRGLDQDVLVEQRRQSLLLSL